MGSMRGRGLGIGLVLLTTACAGTATESDQAAVRDTPSPTRSSPSAAEVCTNQVRYWSRTLLTEGAYQGGDYQHMGLSDAQNEVLRGVMAEAAPMAAAQGVDVAVAFATEQAGPRCEAAYADGGPTSAWG